jgi:flavin-dependent dehydrogenase
MHDVIVVGAGPAGSLAALLLAKAGARVQVVDRARFPRDKLCGDTVNPGAVTLLKRHGLEGVLRGALPVDGMIVTGPSGLTIEGRYGRGVQGRAIGRRELDARLVEAAAAAGAAIGDGTLATGAAVETTGAPRVLGVTARGASGRSIDMRARVVIAADGRHSRVARALGLSRFARAPRRWAVGGYFENVAGLTTCGEMHVRRDCYLGVAPLPGGIANACVVTTAGDALRDPEALLLDSLRTDRALADRFAAARPIAPAACLGPLAVECGMPGTSGLLLAGDAAGFIDPMTGDGLRFALRGAELAAGLALDVLAHGWRDAHVRLGAARRRVFRSKWRFNRTVRALVASPGTVRLADRGAMLAPSVVRGLIRYAADLRVA